MNEEIPISAANTKASVIAAMKTGRVRLRPDINHCRDCERAYEMGQSAPLEHPVVIEVDRRTRRELAWCYGKLVME